jgi:hypothetical protein
VAVITEVPVQSAAKLTAPVPLFIELPAKASVVASREKLIEVLPLAVAV